EGGDLHGLALRERLRHLVEDRLHEVGRLVPRQPDLLIDGLAQMSAGDGVFGHSPGPLAAFLKPYTCGKAPSLSAAYGKFLTLGTIPLPAENRRRPSEAAAHRPEQETLTRLDAAVADRFGQRERNRRGGGIRVLVDRDHNFFRRQSQLARGSF